MKRTLAYGAVFVLGIVVTLVAVQAWPFIAARFNDAPLLGVRVPALSDATYTFRNVRGFDAVLTTQNGQRLTFPRMWLPGDAEVGDRYRVVTEVAPAAAESRFSVRVLPLE